MIKRPEDRPAAIRREGVTTLSLAELSQVFMTAMAKSSVGRVVHGDTVWLEPTDTLLEVISMPRVELQMIAKIPTSRTNGPHIHLHASPTSEGSAYTVIGYRGWMSPSLRPKRRVERFLADLADAELLAD